MTDEKIIRQFTLFANQFRSKSEQRESELLAEAANFRSQPEFIKFVDSNSSPTKTNIAVKKWFIGRVQSLGISLDVDYGNGDVKVVASNPIPMIVKSEMMRGDIVLVDGASGLSNIIKLETWSQFSHAAIYDGYERIYEAVGGGVEGNDLQRDIDLLPLTAVLRPVNYNPAAADNAVNYARKNAGELGGIKRGYDIPGQLVPAFRGRQQ